MELTSREIISPRSFTGSVGMSVAVHAFVFIAVFAVVRMNWVTPTVAPDYIDMDYEMFDAPPMPTIAKPRDPPKELQDETSEIAGTQKEQKPTSTGDQSVGEAPATPYYKIKPKYPRAALLSGSEGWVLMAVDINEQGGVENVRVIGGEMRNMFENEAERAVLKWKYKPFLNSDGQPKRKDNHQVRVDFKLTDVDEG